MDKTVYRTEVTVAAYLAVPDSVDDIARGLAPSLRQNVTVHVSHVEGTTEKIDGEDHFVPGFWQIEGREAGVLVVLWDTAVDNAEAARATATDAVRCRTIFEVAPGREQYCNRPVGHDGQHSA